MEQEKILAWHFIRDDGRTAHGDILVEAGQTYSTDSKTILCEQGFHASERLLDALGYAPGAMLCRVELWGDLKRGRDKIVAQNRHVQWMLDITRLLHEFACEVAEETLRTHNIPDERSWNAIRVKREWVDGKATDEELDAAWAGAWAAARDAARDVARAAAIATESAVAWAVAWATERAAARAAAWAAAGNAAGAAARAAAWAGAAAREAAGLNAMLEARVLEKAGDLVESNER